MIYNKLLFLSLVTLFINPIFGNLERRHSKNNPHNHDYDWNWHNNNNNDDSDDRRSLSPSSSPSIPPSSSPSLLPSSFPSFSPTQTPTMNPSVSPTELITLARSSQSNDSDSYESLFLYIPIGMGALLLLSTMFYLYRHNKSVIRRNIDKVTSDKSISFSNNVGNLYDEFNIDGVDDGVSIHDYEEPVSTKHDQSNEDKNISKYDNAEDHIDHIYYEAVDN